VNGGTLATELPGDGGSRALGEVHEREGGKLTRGDGRDLDATINRDLVEPLTRLNHGREAAALLCPVFKLTTEPPENIEALAKRVHNNVDRGVSYDADEVREKLTPGFKKPDAKSVILKPLGSMKPQATNETKPDDAEASKPGEPANEEDDGADASKDNEAS
jgi:phage gp29-like protein